MVYKCSRYSNMTYVFKSAVTLENVVNTCNWQCISDTKGNAHCACCECDLNKHIKK